VRGQRHGEENKRGVGSVAVNAGAGQIHSLGERACGSGSEEKREREERERGMRKGSGSTVRPGRRGLSEKSPMRCFMQVKDNLQIFSSLHKNKIYIRHLYEKYPNRDSVVGL
jgi:hypothetical protein